MKKMKNIFRNFSKFSKCFFFKGNFWFEKKNENISFIFYSEKIFFSELRKKLGHNFDVENCKLSIGKVFRAIPALCREVGQFKCNTMNSPKNEQKKTHFQNLAEFGQFVPRSFLGVN